MNCVNLLTLDKDKILRKLGSLPDSAIQLVNTCLKAALEFLALEGGLPTALVNLRNLLGIEVFEHVRSRKR